MIAASLFLIAYMAINLVYCEPIDPKDPGAWLARELGTDLNLPASVPVNNNKLKKLVLYPADKSIDAKRDSLRREVLAGRYENAMELFDTFIKELEPISADSDNYQLVTFRLLLHYDRMHCLAQLNRPVEALVEGQVYKNLCSKYEGCKLDQAEWTIKSVEDQLKKSNHYQILGVKLNDAYDKDKIRAAYRKLLLLLHPDKNRNLNKEAQDYLTDLLTKVKESYKVISAH